jgi:hypothetical protein
MPLAAVVTTKVPPIDETAHRWEGRKEVNQFDHDIDS